MSRTSLFTVVGLAALAGTLAIAQPTKEKPVTPGQPAGQPQLPPGWTEQDMQACMEAGTPGPQHAQLVADAGVWQGKSKMWMAPGTPAMESDVTMTITPHFEGRYVKCTYEGDMPGMGPFHGEGVTGFDNVSQKYQGTWIDNHSTGIMFGTGERTSDGGTMNWKYTFNCPVTKKQTTMRQVEKTTGKDTKTLEMFTIDPKSNKEYKMMEIAFTRKSGAGGMGGAR